MGSLSARELDALVEQATVDAYDLDEQLAGFHAVIGDELATPEAARPTITQPGGEVIALRRA